MIHLKLLNRIQAFINYFNETIPSTCAIAQADTLNVPNLLGKT
ncbi:MAG TPA: hypothetical protein V6C93_02455 [Allocoleopsis sp.]